jgi:hypothetical protein
MTGSPRSRLYALVADTLDRLVGWSTLPRLVGLFTLVELRRRLRELNLYDTSEPEDRDVKRKFESRYLTARTPDGTYNDLKKPWMGSAGTPFGRNVPVKYTRYETDQTIRLKPNPRTVSRKLLTRNEGFQPVEGLNLLAASWLQFMVRDWLSHGEGDGKDLWKLPKDQGDEWLEETVDVPRTPISENSPAYPAYKNTETHWWDGSQIYGSDEKFQSRVRAGEDGKLLVRGGLVPKELLFQAPKDGKPAVDKPGFWIGLYMLSTLFTLEHNAICDRLREEYPSMPHEDLFDRARLVNAALLAKIHTIEWTPAILGHPTLQIAMKANWWGLAGEKIHKLLGRVSESEVWSGIPGSKTNHFDVPYAMTEEFVAVYRMHPLIPDELSFRSAYDNTSLGEGSFSFHDVMNRGALKVLEDGIGMRDLFYSFGTLHPGQIRLHNYPASLQRFQRANDDKFMDLAATDILRIRELGVPRYNEFRRLLRLSAPRTFEELTDNKTWARELQEVYEGDIESVDTMIGMYAERFPEKFGFSETAFRIFILMASRRLNSDRFFTTHYTPEVYTEAGMKWIVDNDMTTVLLRHYPGLRPALEGIENAFFPWAETGPRGPGWETDPANITER